MLVMKKIFPIIKKLGGKHKVAIGLKALGWGKSSEALRMMVSRGRLTGEIIILLMRIAEINGIEFNSSDFEPEPPHD